MVTTLEFTSVMTIFSGSFHSATMKVPTRLPPGGIFLLIFVTFPTINRFFHCVPKIRTVLLVIELTFVCTLFPVSFLWSTDKMGALFPSSDELRIFARANNNNTFTLTNVTSWMFSIKRQKRVQINLHTWITINAFVRVEIEECSLYLGPNIILN